MDLFEIFRKKEIKIEPGKSISVEYSFSNNVWEIFPLIGDALLYIKKKLCFEDFQYLKAFNGQIIVKAEEPHTLDEIDVIRKISEIAQYEEIPNIGLNYVHVNDTLYIFSDEYPDPSVPNIVKIYPMKRTDIETLYKLPVIKAEESTSSPKMYNVKSEDDKNTDDPESQTTYVKNDNIIVKYKDDPEKAKELEMVICKLKELFDKYYVVMSVEIKGGIIERRSISLTDFYKNNNISAGRLKGSWSVFGKEDVLGVVESRITGRAMDELNKRYLFNIGGYGKIIKKTDINDFYLQVDQIIKDYIAYLSGKNNEKVGYIKVQYKFNPYELFQRTFNELGKYLLNISVPDSQKNNYYNNIRTFIKRSIIQNLDFSSGICVNHRTTSYTLEQWHNCYFLKKIIQSVDNDKNGFFDPEFKEILSRYEKLITEDLS